MDFYPIWLSLRVASLATLMVFAGGLTLIGFASGMRLPARNFIRMIATLPLVLPPTVLGYYLLVLVGRQSSFGRAFRSAFGFDLVFTWQAAVIAAAVSAFPLFFMTAMPVFENIDESLINAARTLGKSELQVFWRVKIPLAWRGLLAGISLAFSRAIGDFGVTLMLAGSIPGQTQTAPLAVYDHVLAGNRSGANSLAAVTTIFGVGLLFVATLVVQRRLIRS